MAEEFQTTNNDEREIDLIAVLGKIFRGIGNAIVAIIKAIRYVIVWALLFVYRTYKFYLIALIFVVGLFIYKQSQPKVYECNMRLQTVCVNATYAINLVNNWNYNLYLPENISNNIKSITAAYMIDYNGDGSPDAVEDYSSKAMKDTTAFFAKKRMIDYFNVEIKLCIEEDSTILKKVGDELMNYISNDKWIIEKNGIWQNQYGVTISRIRKEIAILDSLQKKEYFSDTKKTGVERGDNGGYLMVAEKDQRLYHNDLLALLNKEQALERNKYPEPFRVIQSLAIPRLPINTTKYNAIYSFIVVMFFATIIIFLYDRRKTIKALAKKMGQLDEEMND